VRSRLRGRGGDDLGPAGGLPEGRGRERACAGGEALLRRPALGGGQPHARAEGLAEAPPRRGSAARGPWRGARASSMVEQRRGWSQRGSTRGGAPCSTCAVRTMIRCDRERRTGSSPPASRRARWRRVVIGGARPDRGRAPAPGPCRRLGTRRHVAGVPRLLGGDAGDAEVGELDHSIVSDEHVRRLDVPVDDAKGVDGSERAEELGEVVPRAREGQARTALQVPLDDPVERLPLAEFHHDRELIAALAEPEEVHDVRVGEPPEGGGLARNSRRARSRLFRLGAALDRDGVSRVPPADPWDRSTARLRTRSPSALTQRVTEDGTAQPRSICAPDPDARGAGRARRRAVGAVAGLLLERALTGFTHRHTRTIPSVPSRPCARRRAPFDARGGPASNPVRRAGGGEPRAGVASRTIALRCPPRL
jgi:hypothetical protein